MVLLASVKLSADFLAPDFNNLPATDGKFYSLTDFADKKLLLIIFMCVHCPYVQAIEPQIIKLQSEFAPQGVQVIGINPNDTERYPQDNLNGMIERAKEKDYGQIVYLRDDEQTVAKAYQAVCTPDIYVFNQERKLVYHGRIEEVAQALTRALAGEPAITVNEQLPSQGCSIKWRDQPTRSIAELDALRTEQ